MIKYISFIREIKLLLINTEERWLHSRTAIFIFAKRGGQSRAVKNPSHVTRDKYYFATRLALLSVAKESRGRWNHPGGSERIRAESDSQSEGEENKYRRSASLHLGASCTRIFACRLCGGKSMGAWGSTPLVHHPSNGRLATLHEGPLCPLGNE